MFVRSLDKITLNISLLKVVDSLNHVTVSLLPLFLHLCCRFSCPVWTVPVPGKSSSQLDDHQRFMVLSAEGQKQESALSLIRAAVCEV